MAITTGRCDAGRRPSSFRKFNIAKCLDILVAILQPNFDRSLKLMKIDFNVFTLATVLAVVLSLSLPVGAQDASALFKSKCAGCHGADGTGSAMGKKMGAHDFTTADVQGMSDAQLADTITNGKNKMPKYASLKPEDIKGLVAYIRTLKK
jgi:mono/diheme cytochrome c family protein